MNRLAFATLLLAIALPATALAQGSGTSAAPTGTVNSPEYPFLVTRIFEGKVAEIRSDQRVIIVEDRNARRFQFKLDEKTKFKADKNTEYAGKKELGLGDLELGQPVRVIYIASNNLVTDLRLLRVRR